MYAHGIQRGAASVADPPISQQIQQRGFAWAASSYRAAEYVPDLGMEDTLALKRLFVREFGPPRWTILYGQSMGGQVVTGSLETWPDEYQAGFAECGLVDGIWEIDFLFAYSAAAELISGVPLLDAPDQNAFGRLMTAEWLPVMGRPGRVHREGAAVRQRGQAPDGRRPPLPTGGAEAALPREPVPARGSRDDPRARPSATSTPGTSSTRSIPAWG